MPPEPAPAARLEDLAGRVLSYSPPGEKDVTIATVLKVLETLIEIYACFAADPPTAAAMCRMPIFRKPLLRRAVSKSGVAAVGNGTVTGMLRLGDEVTADDIAAAVKEYSLRRGVVH